MKKSILIGVVVMLLCLSSIAGAEDTYWISSSGDWSSPINWLYKVPGSEDWAYINNSGTANINGGTAEAYRVFLGTYGTATTINHTAGSATFNNDLLISNNSTYNLSGSGILASPLRVWANFNQSGGTNNSSNIAVQGSTAIYSLSGSGQINSGSVTVRSSGTFIQTGGANNSNNLNVAYSNPNEHGTYQLYGGAINSTEQNIGWGSGSIGNFEHTAGTNTVDNIYLGWHSNSNGNYYLSGTGELFVSGNQVIGISGNGFVEQSGGSNEVGGSIILGRESGSSGGYYISGGTLSTDVLQVGYFGSGDFQINDSSADIAITGSLFFGAFGNNFSAASGSIINMDGASLENWETDPLNLLGLNNVNMAFNGGTGTSLLEVAGSDVGSVWSGTGLFAFDTFSLTSTANVQLVNNRTNMGGTEALYANNCVFGSGSSLDLNGINLYCNDITDYGATINYNGGNLIRSVVPEPISSALFIIGGATLGVRRFWKRRSNT